MIYYRISLPPGCRHQSGECLERVVLDVAVWIFKKVHDARLGAEAIKAAG